MFRIWLKDEAKEAARELKKPPAKSGKVFVKEWGINVRYDRDVGRWYIDWTEPSPFPTVPEDLVEAVTVIETITRNFRPEGIYRWEGVELIVRNRVISPGGRSIHYQEVHIYGPSVEAVKKVYSLFRQGKLQPTEKWE